MKFHMKNSLSRAGTQKEKGQTLIEYALILVLGVLVVIIVLQALGADIQSIFTSVSNAMTN